MAYKYINPFTDFGFKKLFGEEGSKPQLINFLNSLLPQEHQIVDLTFQVPEQLGLNEWERRAIYDIYCTNQNQEHFIVELQKAKHDHFKERMIYYSTYPVQK